MTKEYPLIGLFREFIKATTNGNRLRPDGKKIKPKTIRHYKNTLDHLEKFELASGATIRIRPVNKMPMQQLVAEKKYWKRFYKDFTDHLYKQGCHDNYTGSMVRCIRTVFNYAEKDKLIQVGKFHLDFFISQQEVPIITLMPEQLQKMIYDKAFEESLDPLRRRIKDIFVVGCTVALRFGDLLAIRWEDIEAVGGHRFLRAVSEKTSSTTRIRLPKYVTDILDCYEKDKCKTVFAPISLPRFNFHIRKLAELAGYTQTVGKFRSKRGELEQILPGATGTPYRFCDLVSSHIMRRTAVTTMLMHGVPENVVKKISGHVGGSKAFYRYVNFVDSYMDTEMDKHFKKMESGPKMKKVKKLVPVISDNTL